MTARPHFHPPVESVPKADETRWFHGLRDGVWGHHDLIGDEMPPVSGGLAPRGPVEFSPEYLAELEALDAILKGARV